MSNNYYCYGIVVRALFVAVAAPNNLDVHVATLGRVYFECVYMANKTIA